MLVAAAVSETMDKQLRVVEFFCLSRYAIFANYVLLVLLGVYMCARVVCHKITCLLSQKLLEMCKDILLPHSLSTCLAQNCE